jgi:hypothetical protein
MRRRSELFILIIHHWSCWWQVDSSRSKSVIIDREGTSFPTGSRVETRQMKGPAGCGEVCLLRRRQPVSMLRPGAPCSESDRTATKVRNYQHNRVIVGIGSSLPTPLPTLDRSADSPIKYSSRFSGPRNVEVPRFAVEDRCPSRFRAPPTSTWPSSVRSVNASRDTVL